MSGRRATTTFSSPPGKSTREVDTTDLPAGFQMTELGPLPEGWKVVRLGEVAKVQGGYAFRSAMFAESGVPIIRISNVKEEGVVWRNVVYWPQKLLDPVKSYLLKDGDVLISMTGDVGICSLVRTRDLPALLNQRVGRVVPQKSDVLLCDYLYSLMLTTRFKDAVHKISFGAIQKNVSAAKIESIPIPLPPLPEQRAIAQVLRTVQRTKEATEKVITALKELKKSLMRHLFTYGPVPLDQVDQVRLKETEIGPLPEGWEMVRLGEVCEKPQYGYTTTASPSPVGPKFLRITDIQDEQVNWQAVPYCALSAEELARYQLLPGDIIVARIGATTGKSYLITNCPTAVFASYLIRIRAKSLVSSDFLAAWMKTHNYWRQINSSKGGRLKLGINAPVLKALQIPLPPLPEQRAIAEMLRAVDRKIEAEERRKAALDSLFKTLLHHLMTGKVRVHSALGPTFPEVKE